LGAGLFGKFQPPESSLPLTRRTMLSKIDKPSNFFDFSLIATA